MPIIEALASLGYPATPAAAADTEEGSIDIFGRSSPSRHGHCGVRGGEHHAAVGRGLVGCRRGQTQETFHLVSALIAVPVVAYAGQPFFRSALGALRGGRTNMDVPISIGVLLALALSLFEVVHGGDHVFFNAAVTLLFFLLAGRYLDHRMRERARSAVTGLARLSPQGAMIRQDDGALTYAPLAEVAPGAVLSISRGERVPVDAIIVSGSTDLDRSLVTGEALPVAAGPGDTLDAGTLNLTGTVEARALRSAENSFLAQMIGMQTAAERGRAGYLDGKKAKVSA